MVRNAFAYEIGDDPYGRYNPSGIRCPFCGAAKTILAWGDISENDGRIEFYCDNEHCEVRTFTVIAMTIGRPNGRSDVTALKEIDAGVGSERLPEVINLMDSEDSSLIDLHTAGILGRRKRSAKITVTPDP